MSRIKEALQDFLGLLGEENVSIIHGCIETEMEAEQDSEFNGVGSEYWEKLEWLKDLFDPNKQ